MDGRLKLNDEVEKHGGLVLSPEQKQRTESLLDESEGLRHFVSRHIQSHPSDDLTTNEIIQKYADYCTDPTRGWNISIKLIERQLPNLMMQLFKTTSNNNIQRNGKKVRGYRNVTYVP